MRKLTDREIQYIERIPELIDRLDRAESALHTLGLVPLWHPWHESAESRPAPHWDHASAWHVLEVPHLVEGTVHIHQAGLDGYLEWLLETYPQPGSEDYGEAPLVQDVLSAVLRTVGRAWRRSKGDCGSEGSYHLRDFAPKLRRGEQAPLAWMVDRLEKAGREDLMDDLPEDLPQSVSRVNPYTGRR